MCLPLTLRLASQSGALKIVLIGHNTRAATIWGWGMPLSCFFTDFRGRLSRYLSLSIWFLDKRTKIILKTQLHVQLQHWKLDLGWTASCSSRRLWRPERALLRCQLNLFTSWNWVRPLPDVFCTENFNSSKLLRREQNSHHPSAWVLSPRMQVTGYMF